MYYFSDKHASRAESFFATQLRYVEGAKAGQPFMLEPWQSKIVRDLFGWLREDGTRRYRIAYIEIPRKNGKSTFSAGLALYLLLCDGEERPQVYSCAGDREQASIVFRMAREMIEGGSPALRDAAELWQYKITGNRKGGWYEAASADAKKGHGRNPHGIIFDELHTQPNRDLWDSMLSGRGSRRQPLVVAISTAGHDRQSICWEIHQRALRAIDQPDADPTFYGVIYGADEADDWTDESVWQKANPNLGVSVSMEFLREQCEVAKTNPAEENVFRNLYLNQWTEQAVRAIPMRQWDDCEKLDFAELEGKTCYIGMDLASTRDIASAVAVFPLDDDRYAVLPKFWCPEDSKDARGSQDRAHFLKLIREGHIEATPGNETDYRTLHGWVYAMCERYDVRELCYDPWNASTLIQWIVESGFDIDRCFKFTQTFTSFAEPTAKLISLVKTRKFIHNGNPVLRWMASNFATRLDASGNMRPDKGASHEKIDGIVATIMGLARAAQPGEAPSVYESRGLIYL